uniref:MFS domain-containing protein n=1 Tax=Elaeophora elaphi TaxID=1147741 RepID=A0A0R3S6M1_9BILA
MLPSAKGTNNDDDSSGGSNCGGVELSRKPAIFTVSIDDDDDDDAGHIPSTSINLNETMLTSITTTDSITRSADFNVAAEKCATMVLSTIFENMSLKPDNIYSQSTVASEPDLVAVSKELLKGAKSDAYLLSNTSQHYTHSLSKSDLLELKRSIVKSDFKPVQDPLSASKLRRNCSVDCHPWHSPIFEIGSLDSATYVCESVIDSDEMNGTRPFVLFPSIRLLVAALLCCCFIALSISTSNMAVALICMTSCPVSGYKGDLQWRSEQEGIILAAQNVGSLLMVITGLWADRINGKWMIGGSLLLCAIANVILPLMARESVWYAVGARLAIGAADACLTPATSSLITRWFPQSERAAALGIVTSGRQIGTLFILPTAVALFWIPMGADKPSKQYCISRQEQTYIESRIACESIGKRTAPRHTPWSAITRSSAVWAGIFALICHEYPLVIMLQFLPNYMRDVLHFAPAKNGIASAFPIVCLFVSKAFSCSFSTWLLKHTGWTKTTICKVFNGIASSGLSLCIITVPQFDRERSSFATIPLCCAMLFAGLHTPGVQTALVQLAPPYSGVITGISFFFVAWFGIGNKLLTKHIVQHGTADEWAKVFYLSGIVAALPVIVFTIWGSSERQWWSAPSSKTSSHSLNTQATVVSN